MTRLVPLAAAVRSIALFGCDSSATRPAATKTARRTVPVKTEVRRCISEWNKHAGPVAKYEVSFGLGNSEPIEVGVGTQLAMQIGSSRSTKCAVVFELHDAQFLPLRFGWILHDGVWTQRSRNITDPSSLVPAHSVAKGDIARGARPQLPSVPRPFPDLGENVPNPPILYGRCATIAVPGSRTRIVVIDRQVSCKEAELITIAFVHEQAAEFHPGGNRGSLNVEGWICSKDSSDPEFGCLEVRDDAAMVTFDDRVHYQR